MTLSILQSLPEMTDLVKPLILIEVGPILFWRSEVGLPVAEAKKDDGANMVALSFTPIFMLFYLCL